MTKNLKIIMSLYLNQINKPTNFYSILSEHIVASFSVQFSLCKQGDFWE